jgi:TRAP-type mannitol/chloroaromatic compound transport system substrate-binding protein
MNERLRVLAEQAGFDEATSYLYHCRHEQIERFAALVREDEAKACAEHYLGIMRDAVEQAVLKEREACAKLCEDNGGDDYEMKAAYWCADAIRARRKG